MKKIAVVGCSGAGKTTLAKTLAALLNLPFVACDPIFWEPGWTPVEDPIVRLRLSEALSSGAWVIDGAFGETRHIVWSKADTVIWLDYAFALVLHRVCYRNLTWFITQEPVWSGNRMTLRRAWSGIRHSVTTYATKREAYRLELAGLSNVEVIRLASPQQTRLWLNSMQNSVGS
jgi:hypothetical protein